MMIVLRRIATVAAPFTVLGALLTFASTASAQASSNAPVSTLDRIFSHVDLGVSGVGIFTKNTSGPNDLNGAPVTDSPSNTLGALVTARYTRSPYIGFEANYSYARNDQNYTGTSTGPTGLLQVQTNASEYSLGYVVHPGILFGVHTFVAVGGGAVAFRPTPHGGQGFHNQGQAAAYYNAGVEQQVFNPHFGLRASFRQVFYPGVDYNTNYLTNHQRTFTSEPSFGFFLHF